MSRGVGGGAAHAASPSCWTSVKVSDTVGMQLRNNPQISRGHVLICAKRSLDDLCCYFSHKEKFTPNIRYFGLQFGLVGVFVCACACVRVCVCVCACMCVGKVFSPDDKFVCFLQSKQFN